MMVDMVLRSGWAAPNPAESILGIVGVGERAIIVTDFNIYEAYPDDSDPDDFAVRLLMELPDE